MGNIINKNTDFGILQGSENAPYVYILYAEYADSLKKHILTLTMPNFLNGITHLTFLALSIIILGISRSEAEVSQPTV